VRYALLNPKWSFQGSTYFGCPEPHFPLELLSAREMLRAAGHEVLLVRPQLGVPVGEPDADDVASCERGHSSGGIRRSRMRSNASCASS